MNSLHYWEGSVLEFRSLRENGLQQFFGGVDIDTQEMTVELPQSKVHNLLWLLRELSIKSAHH